MSNFYYELNIERDLQCPVCFEVPPNDIFICRTGHSVCDKCRKKLTVCPSCQEPITSSRNYLAETLITKFSIFKDSENGTDNNNVNVVDKSVAYISKLLDNTSPMKPLRMDNGLYRCMLESCRTKKLMGLGGLYTHVDAVHCHLYEKFQNQRATFTHTFNNFCFMKKSRKFHRVFHVSNMGMFFLNLLVTPDQYINCWLSMPSSVSRANRFEYEVMFSKEEDSNKKITFLNKVASNFNTELFLLERGRIFVISPEKHCLKENNFFSMFFKIVYKTSKE